MGLLGYRAGIISLVMLFFAFSSDAGEKKVYTDIDLSKYKMKPMVDKETSDKREADLASWEKDYEERLLMEKKKQEEAEKKKQTVSIPKKQSKVTYYIAPRRT